MHYAISTKVLGQTHMWYTQKQVIKLFEDFSIFMDFWIFWTHSKTKQEKWDQQQQGKAKLVKENMQ